MSAPRSYDHVKTRFVRCANCNTRHALAKPLRDYVRVPRCRCCHKRHWWQDNFRERRRKAERVTMCIPWKGGCGMYHYPHRKGSGRCWFNESDELTKGGVNDVLSMLQECGAAAPRTILPRARVAAPARRAALRRDPSLHARLSRRFALRAHALRRARDVPQAR